MTVTNPCGKLIFDWDDEDLNDYCVLEENHEGPHSDGQYFYNEDGTIITPACADGPLSRARGRAALERSETRHKRCWY